MRILVTGGAGYIGGMVAIVLARQGHTVVVYDNFCHSTRDLLPAGASLVQGDLADRPRLENLLASGFDGVMHLAALIEAGESMRVPEVYFRNNTASSLSLLESMISTGVHRIVFSSTAAVYGQPDVTPIPEDAPLRPTNPYGESKLLVEKMLSWMYRVHGLRYASLRYFNVAGAMAGRGEAHEPESHLIPLVLDVARGRRDRIKIYGDDYPTPDGTCIRDYIHVEDLAEAHLLAYQALEDREQLIYNLGNGAGFSVREVIESARRVTGHPIPVDVVPRRPGDPAVLIASSEKIGRELGWKPRHTSLDAIIASAWEWHQIRYKQ
ncbi:MAG TPA: UDP-glucose 4-epimerase GalE [Acidobacteriaceae bacterium]|nr:UDP-glucose 4-epimerase GalE [Acidobacteriaceae bacterium]